METICGLNSAALASYPASNTFSTSHTPADELSFQYVPCISEDIANHDLSFPQSWRPCFGNFLAHVSMHQELFRQIADKKIFLTKIDSMLLGGRSAIMRQSRCVLKSLCDALLLRYF